MVAYRSAPLTGARTDSTGTPSRETAPSSETWQERLFAALPLFIVGGACLALTFDFYLTNTATGIGSSSGVRLQPWSLFLALAITGIAAGTFAMFVEDEEPATVAPTVAPVSTTPSASPTTPVPAAVPEWDESVIEPEKQTYVPFRIWERPPDANERSQAASVSPDLVFNQIDEIEASLRKKKQLPRSGSGEASARK
jgi:hypothetical protein